MPPKKAKAVATSSTSQVYIVTSSNGIDSVYASIDSANDRVAAAKEEGNDLRVESKDVQGGSVQVDERKVSKAEAEAKAKDEAPKANTSKKTKPAAEQRAANAKKLTKSADVDLPDNIKALLNGSGTVFSGMTVVVTGIPPIIGRKNAEKLVENYGGHLGKSLSKKTNLVIVGNDAGPKKLEQIEGFGLETKDEDELIEFLERALADKKRGADDEEEEDEDEEEEVEKPSKSKKQKR